MNSLRRLFLTGFLDFVYCLALSCYFANQLLNAYETTQEPILVLHTYIITVVSAFTILIPCFAVMWSSTILVGFWASLSIGACLYTTLVNLLMPSFLNWTVFIAFIFFMARMLFLLCIAWFTNASLVQWAANQRKMNSNINGQPAKDTPRIVSRPVVSITYGYRPFHEASPGDMVVDAVNANNNADRYEIFVFCRQKYSELF